MGVGAQGHSAAVKEAVSASLLGCKAPFRLVQDHSRSGRLEASTLALRKWLFSDQFDRYLSLVQVQPLLPRPLKLARLTSCSCSMMRGNRQQPSVQFYRRCNNHWPRACHFVNM